LYYKQADGLRAVAIGLVLFAHFAAYLAAPLKTWWTGVELFFVISGFLITSILIKKDDKNFSQSYKTFIIRRSFRIFPVFYLLIIVLLILQVPEILKTYQYLFTYTLNYSPLYEDAVAFKFFWSLCVEEQFYLFFPLVVLPLRNSPIVLTVVIVAIFLIGTAQSYLNIFPSIEKYNFIGVFPRMATLSLGAMVALVVRYRKRVPVVLNNKIFEITLLILAVYSSCVQAWWCYLILSLCCFVVVLKSVTDGFKLDVINHALENKYVVWVGKLSYGIYLFHMPVQYFLDPHLTIIWGSINFEPLGKFKAIYYHPYLFRLPIYSLISIGIAYLSYWFIEMPILRFKNRKFGQ
jgi:peptidoglycan/LPS O-acetylase OafA/YrhL